MNKKWKESSANGIEGNIIVSGGNMSFMTKDKIYRVSSFDFDVKITDKTAILKKYDKKSYLYKQMQKFNTELIDRIDYSNKSYGLKDKKELDKEVKAFGTKGCLFNYEPWVLIVNDDCIISKKRNAATCYQIWHQTLKIKILDKDAAFYSFDNKKSNWDGILDYSSKSQGE